MLDTSLIMLESSSVVGHFAINVGESAVNVGHFANNVGESAVNVGHFANNVGKSVRCRTLC